MRSENWKVQVISWIFGSAGNIRNWTMNKLRCESILSSQDVFSLLLLLLFIFFCNGGCVCAFCRSLGLPICWALWPHCISVFSFFILWWHDYVSRPAVWLVLRYLPPRSFSLWLHQASLCHSSCSCVPTLYPPLWIQLLLSHIKGSHLEGLFSIHCHVFSCTFSSVPDENFPLKAQVYFLFNYFTRLTHTWPHCFASF